MEIKIEDDVAVICINRPHKSNALDFEAIESLSHAVAEAEANTNARAVLLRGRGRHFCAGADIEWMRRSAEYSLARNAEEARAFAELLLCLDAIPKPLVVEARGAVYGGGGGLACCADFCIAAESAKFCFPETKLGIAPATIAPFVVAAIGAKQARRLFLTNEIIGAVAARELGIVHEVVADSQIEFRAKEIAMQFKSGAPSAQAVAKKLARQVAGEILDSILSARTAKILADTRASDEGKEGLAAHLQKRKPKWNDD